MADGQSQFQIESEWANRSQYWISEASKSQPKRLRRERQTAPLVLTGHGLSIRVDRSCLLIRGGNTHYPAEKRELRYFRGSLDIPPRIVLVDGSGNISIDAIDWMAEQGIAFVRINYDGSYAVAFSPNGYAAAPDKVRWQLETRDSAQAKLRFAKDIIRQKLEAALDTLIEYVPNSKGQLAAIETTRAAISELPKAKSIPVLFSVEGKAALAYWTAWRSIAMKWKSENRYPIPDEWKSFNARSSVLSGKKWKNWRAANPINAMLNYAYAVLLTELRIKAIADGYDPMLGILHDQRHKEKDRTPSFALDLMEPFRPVVDRAVLKLVWKETFSGADFVLQSDGVCRLNPELARRVVVAAEGVIGAPFELRLDTLKCRTSLQTGWGKKIGTGSA